MSERQEIDPAVRTEIESRVFRKLIEHLQKYPEVQNIDLMNLGYFCRNCISKWYRSAAAERGLEIDYDRITRPVTRRRLRLNRSRHSRNRRRRPPSNAPCRG
jgi:hypothetical protein